MTNFPFIGVSTGGRPVAKLKPQGPGGGQFSVTVKGGKILPPIVTSIEIEYAANRIEGWNLESQLRAGSEGGVKKGVPVLLQFYIRVCAVAGWLQDE